MTPGVVVLCAATLALAAYAISAAVGAGLWVARHRIDALAPAARARIALFAALLPLLLGALALVAVLSPSFGWIADHCGPTSGAHAHPHICTTHPAASLPAVPLVILAAILGVRVGWAVVVRVAAVVRSSRMTTALLAGSKSAGAVRILPISGESRAFVVGLLRPVVFVTEGLFSGADRRHLEAVLAHERGHIARRDPLARLVAGVGLAFHLPGVARWIELRLARSQELAADRLAAVEVGAEPVARALVALARGQAQVPSTAFAFTGASVEDRVLHLMDDTPRVDRPRTQALVVTAFAVALMVALGAGGIHHGLEAALGALGG